MKLLILFMLSLVLLSGCATKWDVGLNGQDRSADVVALEQPRASAISTGVRDEVGCGFEQHSGVTLTDDMDETNAPDEMFWNGKRWVEP